MTIKGTARDSIAERARERGIRDKAKLLDRARRARERELLEGPMSQSDPLRPRLHVTAPVGRLNDPNGLFYAGGTFHAYYQYSPLWPERAVFWGHATSRDLISWHREPTALEPIDFFDSHGCYSGGAVLPGDGSIEYFYTGNVKDDDGNREPYQCVAISSDGGKSLRKLPANPLIARAPAGYTAHFRDPDVHARDLGWMMLLGAQRENGTGAIVRYNSNDRRAWGYAGEIEFSIPAMDTLGYMIECPILVRVPEHETGVLRDVLIFCPQGMPAQRNAWNNVHNIAYLVGELRGTYFEATGTLSELDHGFEAYAPQAFTGVHDRALLMTWCGNPDEDDQPSLARGWVHALGFPRELTLRGGELRQRFARELDTWGSQVTTMQDGDVTHRCERGTVRMRGRCNVEHGLVRLSIAGDEGEVLVSLDSDILRVDRSRSRYVPGEGMRERRINTTFERDFDLLLDRTCLELITDDGTLVFSMRVFVGDKPTLVARAIDGAQLIDVQVFGEEE